MLVSKYLAIRIRLTKRYIYIYIYIYIVEECTIYFFFFSVCAFGHASVRRSFIRVNSKLQISRKLTRDIGCLYLSVWWCVLCNTE